jgi:diguanylate cyclase (GGDEF)-like protein
MPTAHGVPHLTKHARALLRARAAQIGIDDFKQINDTQGHQVGDAVLQDLVTRIGTRISEADYLFRMGGEEFLILLPGTRLEQAVEIAEPIRICIERATPMPNSRTVTVSGGVAQVRKGASETCLYKRLGDRLYHSKHNGKNRLSD